MVAPTKRDWLEVYGDEYRERGLYIVAAHFDAVMQTIHVKLQAGMTVSVPKERVQGLAHATGEQLAEVIISPGGWSVEFPRVDEGISLEGLLSGRFGNDRWEREWAEKHPEMQAA